MSFKSDVNLSSVYNSLFSLLQQACRIAKWSSSKKT